MGSATRPPPDAAEPTERTVASESTWGNPHTSSSCSRRSVRVSKRLPTSRSRLARKWPPSDDSSRSVPHKQQHTHTHTHTSRMNQNKTNQTKHRSGKGMNYNQTIGTTTKLINKSKNQT